MEEEEEAEEVEEEAQEAGLNSMQSGMTSNAPSELEPSESLNLRKDTRSFSETPVPQDLYQVLPERRQNISDKSFMDSDHVHQMSKEPGIDLKQEPVVKQSKAEKK